MVIFSQTMPKLINMGKYITKWVQLGQMDPPLKSSEPEHVESNSFEGHAELNWIPSNIFEHKGSKARISQIFLSRVKPGSECAAIRW